MSNQHELSSRIRGAVSSAGATHILAWARHGGVEAHYLFEDRGSEVTPGGAGVMLRGGHTTYSPDHESRWILNDHKRHYQDRIQLYLYDTRTSRADRPWLVPFAAAPDG